MEWQVVAMWLVVGGVVIWIAARIMRKYMLRDKNRHNDGEPPCCN